MATDLKKMLKVVKNPYGSIASQGILGDNFRRIDTGSYALNALLSADIYGGFPSNRIISFSAPQASGKSYIAQSCGRYYLEDRPTNKIVMFETEGAQTSESFKKMGIDTDRLLFLPIETVEDLHTQFLNIMAIIEEQPAGDKDTYLFILDSLGGLSTNKELKDRTEGATTKDMTRASLVKAFFRTCDLKLAKNDCAMIVINHTYADMGSMFPGQVISGGSGMQYSSSANFVCTKSKDLNSSKAHIGTVITCTGRKNRFVRENLKIQFAIKFNSGLDRYYGLFDIAVDAGIIVKEGKSGFLFNEADGKTVTKITEANFKRTPAKYWSTDRLNLVNEWIKVNFAYGSGEIPDTSEVPDDFDESEI